jgi:altronate hydrolase
LNPNDDVVIALQDIAPGTRLSVPGSGEIVSTARIPAGHKMATRPVAAGSPVHRYSQIIGFASREILPGDHVHVHNLAMGNFVHDHTFSVPEPARAGDPGFDVRQRHRAASPLVFQGIVRPDGRVATRNYIGVISSVNCSAFVCRSIADAFRGAALDAYPNVDGVVSFTHKSGCGLSAEGLELFRRVQAGYMRHPNFAAVLLIGLGCEHNQIASFMEGEGLDESNQLRTFTLQETGGTRTTIENGVQVVREMLPAANRVSRQPVPLSHLTLALQCGGSDGYSGITCNPALGVAADLLIEHGGAAILSETPEIYGADHLLTRRAVSRSVAEKLLERIRWWEQYTTRLGAEMNSNPSPGNKDGGLTTILEKALGATAKGGSSALTAVLEYAQPVATRGLVFMDAPGLDAVGATGQVAGGANLICFTTGRGSAFGCKPSPSIKLASNSALYRRMNDDMDFNCGEILDGDLTVQQAGEKIFQLIIETASGRRTKSELLGIGEDEFAPWIIGPTM